MAGRRDALTSFSTRRSFNINIMLNKQVQVRRHFKVLIEYKLMIIQHKITIAKVEKDEFRRGR